MKTAELSVDEVLSNLIEICKDEEESFHSAADDVHEPQLQSLLLDFASQRAEFARELETCASPAALGPRDLLNSMGLLHRSWIQFRIALASGRGNSILEECERGESGALEVYRDSLTAPLPQEVTAILERHVQELEAAVQRVHELREGLREKQQRQNEPLMATAG